MTIKDDGQEIFHDCAEELQTDASTKTFKDAPFEYYGQTALETPRRTSESELNPYQYPLTPATSSSKTRTPNSPQTPYEQIEEKYHAVRAEYDNNRYVACREKCMDLLRSRHLPPTTRCQTLQLLASCSYYHGAKHALEQALVIASQLGDLDPDEVLRKDVERLLKDLEDCRPEGRERQYIKELEYDED